MARELILTDTFKANYKRLPLNIQKRFNKQLTFSLENPQHPSLKIHRYKTEKNIWEAYINNKYRFTFSVEPEAFIFRNIGSHAIIDQGKVR